MEMKWKGIILILIFFGVGFTSGYGLVSALEGGGRQSITVTGSTTVLPIAKDAATEYMKLHSDVTVSVSGGGSGHGYSAIASGEANIGDHSRRPDAQEIRDARANNVNLTLHVVGIDALTVIVHPSVVPENADSITLTRGQIGKIFNESTFGIHTWGDVEDKLGVNVNDSVHAEDIRIFDRESGSGTREVFVERCLREPFAEGKQLTMNPNVGGVQSNKEMLQNVKAETGAIGYIGLGYLTSEVSAVKINETETIFNPPELKSGGSNGKNLSAYPLSRELYMSTDGYLWKVKPLTAGFLNFVMSEKGAEIVKNKGFFPPGEERVYRWNTVKTWV